MSGTVIRRVLPSIAAIFVLVHATPDACTTFCVTAGDRVLFGRNYDFEIGDGIVLTNPAGLRKRGILPDGPAWTAAHGSITFNQFGRDFPMGGMNEAGVVVELMWLDVTRYPDADTRSPLGVLEWIQYQLDTADSVEDVIASDARVRISGVQPLHYLVADSSGDVAAIEFLGGRLVTHRGTALPVPVLANDTYASSLAFTQRRRAPAGGSDSLARYSRVAAALPQLRAGDVRTAFAALASASQRSTRWSIVWDLTRRTVQWRTDRTAAIRSLAFGELDFRCSATPMMIDVHARVEGNARPELAAYTPTANRDLVYRSYRATSFTRSTPQAELVRIAEHPDSARCDQSGVH